MMKAQGRPVDNPSDFDPCQAENSTLPASAGQRFVQAPAASKILGVHQTTLVRWAKQGRIPAYASPGKTRTIWLFDIAEITHDLREHSLTIARQRRNLIERPSLTREAIQKITREIRTKTLRKTPNQ